MVNITRRERARQWEFWRRGDVRFEPVEREGVRIMSVGFLLGERQALTLQAPLLAAALRQLVENVNWGSLDVLLIDLPPGTADLQQHLLAVTALDAALVVVGPQDVAHLDARKFIDFVRDMGVQILGIENMSGLACPHCGERIDVFEPVAEERSVWSEGLELLGRIPLEPRPTADSAWQAGNFDGIAARLVDRLEQPRAA
jgi:ATP-binding protein involved in chromosome partitioning